MRPSAVDGTLNPRRNSAGDRSPHRYVEKGCTRYLPTRHWVTLRVLAVSRSQTQYIYVSGQWLKQVVRDVNNLPGDLPSIGCRRCE